MHLMFWILVLITVITIQQTTKKSTFVSSSRRRTPSTRRRIPTTRRRSDRRRRSSRRRRSNRRRRSSRRVSKTCGSKDGNFLAFYKCLNDGHTWHHEKYAADKVCAKASTAKQEELVKQLIATLPDGKTSCPVKRDIIDPVNYHFRNLLPNVGIVKEEDCNKRGTLDERSDSFNMCKECTYKITLPERFINRHHFHVTCHTNENDFSCMRGEGICIENLVEMILATTKTKNGHQSFSEEKVIFSRSCSCEIGRSSFLRHLLL